MLAHKTVRSLFLTVFLCWAFGFDAATAASNNSTREVDGKIVNIKGIGKVRFPDSMSEQEIILAIENDIIPQHEAKQKIKDVMPIHKVTGPDKHVYEFEAPEGASETTILRYAKKLHEERISAGIIHIEDKTKPSYNEMVQETQTRVINAPSLSAEFGGAFMTTAVLFIFAALFFKLITFGLTRKTLDTPEKCGRWVMGIMAALSIASASNYTNKTAAEFFYNLALILIPLTVIGFVVGYFWKKSTQRQSSTNYTPVSHDNEKHPTEASNKLNPDNQEVSMSNLSHPSFPESHVPYSAPLPTHDDEKYWEQVSVEFNSDNRREGLWTKCFVEAKGDEKQAKISYLELRFNQLKNEINK